MKKIIYIAMFLASSLSFTSPTWIEYLIKVDNPQNAAKIVAATDKFMSSDFVKNNFKGSLHLNAYIAGGEVEETHSFVLLQPSLAEHEIWLAKVSDPNNEEVITIGPLLDMLCISLRGIKLTTTLFLWNRKFFFSPPE